MTVRRLFALVLFAVWLAPAATAGAVALHVALDHHGDVRGGGSEMAATWTHGHDHPEGAADHDHLATVSPVPALRMGAPDGRSAGAAPALDFAPVVARPAPALALRAAPAPTARSHGPDLLSLLSLLRV